MTLAKRVIPCLDVDAGRVVKGTRFQDLRDAGDPVELAARYDREGAVELVFLDITATVEGRSATLDVISRTAEQVFIPLTVGGGVREEDDVKTLLRAGADKVSLNSAAVRDPSSDSLRQVLADWDPSLSGVYVDLRARLLVTDDAASSDRLQGDAGTDWFWSWDLTDVLDLGPGEQRN